MSGLELSLLITAIVVVCDLAFIGFTVRHLVRVYRRIKSN